MWNIKIYRCIYAKVAASVKVRSRSLCRQMEKRAPFNLPPMLSLQIHIVLIFVHILNIFLYPLVAPLLAKRAPFNSPPMLSLQIYKFIILLMIIASEVAMPVSNIVFNSWFSKGWIKIQAKEECLKSIAWWMVKDRLFDLKAHFICRLFCWHFQLLWNPIRCL